MLNLLELYAKSSRTNKPGTKVLNLVELLYQILTLMALVDPMALVALMSLVALMAQVALIAQVAQGRTLDQHVEEFDMDLQ